MHRNTLETVMGAIVLLAAVGFVALAYEAADVKGKGGYEISAEFGSTGGLLVGDDVRISGIKVGQITAQQLDSITYVAKVSKCQLQKPYQMSGTTLPIFICAQLRIFITL